MRLVPKKAGSELGLGEILTEVSSFASSIPAKEFFLAQAEDCEFAPSKEQAELLQARLKEAMALLSNRVLYTSLAELPSSDEIFINLRKGQVLEIQELRDLRSWLTALSSWHQFAQSGDLTEFPLFLSAIALLHDPGPLLRRLEKILTPDGEMSDSASALLSSIQKDLRRIRASIEQRLHEVTLRVEQQGALQDRISDFREEHYVIAVKSSHQRHVDGVVRDASVSRQTVYVEPKEIETLSKEFREKKNAWYEEVFRILKEFSDSVREDAGALSRSVEELVTWDRSFAAARWGNRFEGSALEVSTSIELRQAAHPLLFSSMGKDSIVSNSVDLKDSSSFLMITGPNTGGKTVLLKTIGFAACALRLGLPIPATKGARVPFFEELMVDLGDPQDIGSKQSSFSGRMQRAKEMLASRSESALILIDEFNSATDPKEGAALSRAILGELMGEEKGRFIVFTTHDPILKQFAFQDSRVESSAMVFDEQTNRPTYILQKGILGESRPFEVAKSLGLPERVLSRARGYSDKRDQDLQQMVQTLEKESLEMKRKISELSLREKTLAEKEEEFVRTRREFEQNQVRRFQERMDEIVTSKKASLDSLKIPTSSRLELKTKVSEIKKEGIEEARREITTPGKEAIVRSGDLSVGDVVFVASIGKKASVVDIASDELVWVAPLGVGAQMKLSVKMNDLKRLDERIERRSPSVFVETANDHISSRLDLRGLRYEDGMRALERYLDEALRSGLAEVTIIHGVGTGALREGSIALFSKHVAVESFRPGLQEEGGAGVSIVRLAK